MFDVYFRDIKYYKPKISILIVFAFIILNTVGCGIKNSDISSSRASSIKSVLSANTKTVSIAVKEVAEIPLTQSVVDKAPVDLVDERYGYVRHGSGNSTLIEFFDYRCPHCREADALVKIYKEKNPDSTIVLIDTPILGPESVLCAKADIAARRQSHSYELFHSALINSPVGITMADIEYIANQSGLNVHQFSSDMKKVNFQKDIGPAMSVARIYKISEVPLFILNGKVHEGVNLSIRAALAGHP